MCRQSWCRGVVLDVTLEMLGSVADGGSVEDALCACLARPVGAAAVAHIVVDASTSRAAVTIWPPTADGQPWTGSTDCLPPFLSQLLVDVGRDPAGGSVCVEAGDAGWPSASTTSPGLRVIHQGELATVPLQTPGPQLRLAVLARHHAFEHRDIHVLECLRGPLGLLLSVSSRAREGRAVDDRSARQDPGLTSREIEVLRLVAQGLLARTIATRLRVSPRTVHKHLGSAYRKLDAHDRLAAVRRAEKLGLLHSIREGVPPSDRSVATTARW